MPEGIRPEDGSTGLTPRPETAGAGVAADAVSGGPEQWAPPADESHPAAAETEHPVPASGTDSPPPAPAPREHVVAPPLVPAAAVPPVTAPHDTPAAEQAATAHALPGAPRSETQLAILAELRGLVQPRGWQTLLLLLAVVVGVPLITAMLLFAVISGSVGENLPVASGDAVSILMLGWGLLLGGGIDAVGTVLGSTGGVGFTVVALGTFATIWALSWLVVRLRYRGDIAHGTAVASGRVALLARSAVEAAAIAVVAAIIAAFARWDMNSGVSLFSAEVSVTSRPFAVFLWTLVLVGTAAFAARLSVRRLPVRAPRLSAVLREIAWYFAIPVSVLTVLALVGLLVAGLNADPALPQIALAWIPLGVNLGLYAFAAGQFGRVVAGTGPGATQAAYAWELLRGWGVALVIITLLLLLFVAIFLGVRRTRTGRFEAGRIWQLPLGVFLVYGFLAVAILPLSGDVLGFGGVAGLSWETTLLVAVFAGAVSAGAEVLPAFVHGINPALLSTLAGKKATARWITGSTRPAADASAAGAPAVPLAAAAGDTLPLAPADIVDTVPLLPTEAANATQPTVPLLSPAAVAGGPPAPEGSAPELTPMSAKSKRATIAVIGGLVGVGLLVAAGAVTINVLNSLRDPAAEVSAYLGLLENGKYDEATATVNPGVKNDQRVLLTSAAAADATPLTVDSVETTSRGDGRASVRAKYSVDGEQFTRDFTVSAGPNEFLVLNTWRLDEPLIVPVSLRGPADLAVTVGGAEVTLPSAGDGYGAESSGVGLYAYPGIYPVSGDGGKFYEVTGATLRATSESGENGVALERSPSDALRDAVFAKVSERLKACGEIPTNMDSECPSLVRDTDLSAFAITPPKSFSSFENGRFETERYTATATRDATMWNKNPTPTEREYTMSGTYEVADGEVEVDFNGSWW
ncbi:hypothetical protein [Microbacterium gorillae]|uniref:hypothetical protein n=1 Tax=Microbacterium gorillae TaxID=1231063 RepID=UPI0012B5F464|nr:hypothetical protein [Microbacterium gorillae]